MSRLIGNNFCMMLYRQHQLYLEAVESESFMSASILSVRVESQVKQSFVDLCEELGLTASAAVNMFMRQMLREKAFPFRPSLKAVDESETSGAISLDELASIIKNLSNDYPQISNVVLFGSLARNEAGPDSDIDLRVTYDAQSNFGLLGMASFSAAIEEATGRSVDVVSASMLDDELADAIERDGVVLYERA